MRRPQVIGCDPETLKATFADYNENATNKTEDEFGLVPERAVLEEGPYYISRAASAVHMTKGGVGCNEMAQVLYENGGVVDSLYACGEVTWQSGGYSQSVVFAGWLEKTQPRQSPKKPDAKFPQQNKRRRYRKDIPRRLRL